MPVIMPDYAPVYNPLKTMTYLSFLQIFLSIVPVFLPVLRSEAAR
jgi:hypothetical protein